MVTLWIGRRCFILVGPIGTSQITYSVLGTQCFTSTSVEIHRIRKVVWTTTNRWSATTMQFPEIYYATHKLLMAKLLHFEPMLHWQPNLPTHQFLFVMQVFTLKTNLVRTNISTWKMRVNFLILFIMWLKILWLKNWPKSQALKNYLGCIFYYLNNFKSYTMFPKPFTTWKCEKTQTLL
jgi:hypothetical protein